MNRPSVAFALLASSLAWTVPALAEEPEAAPSEPDGPATDAGSPVLIGPQRPEHLLKIEHRIRKQRVDLPVVAVQVNGRPCWMVLDTGASTHVISQRLVRALGLPLSENGRGKDHLGNDVDAGLVEGATIVAPGWVLNDSARVGTAEVTGKLEKLGVDGFLSPQLLAPPGESVVLDLKAGLLWTAPHAEAEAQLRGMRLSLTPPWPRVCQRPPPVPFRLYVLPTIIEGTAQNLLIDTGATHTTLSLFALRGTPLTASSQGRGAGGAPRQRLRAADLRIGRFEATGDLPLLPGNPSAACPYDGALGLDILAACTLVLGPSQAAIACP